MLRLPDALAAPVRVGVERVVVPAEQRPLEPSSQHPDVGERQVEALGAGRRDGVPGVAGQQQPAVAHRLATKLRNRSTVRSKTGPSVSLNPSAPASRVWSCSQIRSSDQSSRPRRVALEVHPLDASVRWLISANPRAELL